MPPFGRLITAMVTPMLPDLAVDYPRAAELADRLVASGSEGLVVAGTTGESPTLSKDEKLRLFQTVRDAVRGRAQVVVGTGSNNTADTVALSRAAGELGIDGLLLVTPYYNKPPQEGLYQHFAAVARATAVPIMLYNVPSRTACNLAAATTVRLARDYPSVVAVKECVTEQVSEILHSAPTGFAVYSGDDAATLLMLAQGAVGVVSVASHVVGPDIRAMVEAFARGDSARAAALHRQLLPVFQGLFAVTNPILVKAALDLLGFPVGSLRPPLIAAGELERSALARVLTAAGLVRT